MRLPTGEREDYKQVVKKADGYAGEDEGTAGVKSLRWEWDWPV